ncbi:NTP transferase domain-containing protein [Pelotomaculum isophthalicicum JI]|uniref:NTP transferase domain-containing protein n=1 Tax=Pelotomaculum isophthalicicum JI TaxID=947010 RepID=A0A9X4JTQ8_9FIRM|nr:NTP transferase domain-containing protein [Pelotomaculum isophthalicicum]MDF9409144.1 NTP transferase domain-containing protein [Pelotomaculum isophthalicicum JI]
MENTFKDVRLKPKVVAVILARLTSTRLPRKGLKDICGRPLLGHIVERLKRVKSIDQIVMATTSRSEDIPLKDFSEKEGIGFFAYEGDPEDVVDRTRAAAELFGADILVQISGDCPLVHPPITEKLILALLESGASRAVISRLNGKEAIHEGIAVFSMEGWVKVDKNSTKPHQRENLVACLMEYPELLEKVEVMDDPVFYTYKHRISVDTQADLEFMREIYRRLYKNGEVVDLAKVIGLLKKEPRIAEINSLVHQKGLLDKSKRVLFRVDAGNEIGMGHIVRCLALASCLTEEHFCGIAFIIKGNHCEAEELIIEKGFKMKTIPADVSLEDELMSIIEFTKEYQANAIILDLKEKLNKEYVVKLKESKVPVISIDNYGEGSFVADVVIIPGMHWQPEEGKYYPGVVYHGWEYVMLRKEFNYAYPTPENKIPNVLIAMGGGDSQNLTAMSLISLLPLLPEIRINIIVGRFYSFVEELKTLINNNPQVILHVNIKNPAPIMASADIALTSFGVTMYELASLGVPVITLNPTLEHDLLAEKMKKYGFLVNLGFFKAVDKKDVFEMVSRLINDRSVLPKMAQKGRDLLSGNGIRRIAGILMKKIN